MHTSTVVSKSTSSMPPGSSPTHNTQKHMSDITLRQGRPEWSMEWRNAKTGGVSTHRRHCVRSGLMKAALDTTLQHAIQVDTLDEFFSAAQRILEAKQEPVTTLQNADLLVDRLFHRLHNNHMNIFYGRGSFNQMLGTLAHGLERVESDYSMSIQAAESPAQLKSLAVQWVKDVFGYALGEYMGFSQVQEENIKAVLEQHFDLNEVEFNADSMMDGLSELQLFEHRELEGPMEVKVHQDRQAQLVDVVGFLSERLRDAFEHLHDIECLKVRLVDVATETLDSANLDLSEASDPMIRGMQNQQGVTTTIGFQKLVDEPSIEHFEDIAVDFLSLEKKAGAQLGIGEDYTQWFQKAGNRHTLFSAITAPEEMMVPTMESAKYSPRTWDHDIRQAFNVSEGQQRVQVLPSVMARQVGYAMSNYAVAHGQVDQLKRAYEEILAQDSGSIATLADLQSSHSQLIHRIHNNPTNLFITSRADQMARENISFALESQQAVLLSVLRGNKLLPVQVNAWLQGVLTTAIAGYLELTREELTKVEQIVSHALGAENAQDTLKENVLTVLPQHLEMYDVAHLKTGPLGRYSRHQIPSLQRKIELVLDIFIQMRSQALAICVQELPREAHVHQLQKLSTQIQEECLLRVPSSTVPVIQDAHAHLQSLSAALYSFKAQCLRCTVTPADSEVSLSLIDEYVNIMRDVIETAGVARDFGLQQWAAKVVNP